MNKDEKWMEIAINEAKIAMSENEVPVGAILIKNERLIAKAHNQPIFKNDATAHAEIQVLQKGGDRQKNYRLVGTTLYVTLEPCTMCFGAMMHARIERVVYGAYDSKTGVCGSCADLSNATFFRHKINISGGILKNECSKLLKEFFTLRR